jgi:NADH:ubiquinone oxidoreductase subunit 6 (subunit J)
VQVPEVSAAFGSVREMGRLIFTEFVVPVELIGLVLLSSIIGAGVLARRRLD